MQHLRAFWTAFVGDRAERQPTVFFTLGRLLREGIWIVALLALHWGIEWVAGRLRQEDKLWVRVLVDGTGWLATLGVLGIVTIEAYTQLRLKAKESRHLLRDADRENEDDG